VSRAFDEGARVKDEHGGLVLRTNMIRSCSANKGGMMKGAANFGFLAATLPVVSAGFTVITSFFASFILILLVI